MKKTLINLCKLWVLIAFLPMLSCQNAPISSTENILDSSGVAPMPIANDLGIELNNGKKWLVDSAMMVYLRAMENDILLAASMGEIDYKGLSQKLQSTADRLTSNCTMKGKAHDELHKWLLPYLDMLEELSQAKDEKTATATLEKMKQSYLVFNQFFY